MRYGSYCRFNLGPMVIVSSRRMLKRFFIDKHCDNKDVHFRTYQRLEVASIVPTFLFPSIADADVQGRLRTDIDATLENLCLGDSMQRSPTTTRTVVLENISLRRLVASAVIESLRLCTLPASPRIASTDIEFQAGNASALLCDVAR